MDSHVTYRCPTCSTDVRYTERLDVARYIHDCADLIIAVAVVVVTECLCGHRSQPQDLGSLWKGSSITSDL